MALDKQKILNELGNVVNQLQSADCGCMGKLFSNTNQSNPNIMTNQPHNGYMQGYCHGHGPGHSYGQGCHGHNAPGAGEPFSGNRHCMGHCNPPKLYADTYNYLNHNLMQPVVKEVYDDLKSITPTNTVMNNPMAAQMGLSQGNNSNPPGAGAMGGNVAPNQIPEGAMGNQNVMSNYSHAPNVRFGNTNMGNNNNPQQMAQPMAPMAGMGPNIVNMMMGDAAARAGNQPNPGGPQTGIMRDNAPQSPGTGPPSSMRAGDGQGQYNMGMAGSNQYNTGNMQMNSMGQGNQGASLQNPTMQYMPQPNMYSGANANVQGNPMNGNMRQMNPGTQQMRSMSASPAQPQINAGNPYGVHTAGITKFNEMFPGVMQGGDLGFDPMAIAIQMNPANQQKAAMDTMQKMMMSNGEGLSRVNGAMMQPVINATNAAAASIAQNNQSPVNQAPSQQNMVPIQQQMQQSGANATATPVQNNQIPQQQVYTAVTGEPTLNQQQVSQNQIPSQQQQQQKQYQQYQGHYKQPQQQMIDPNTGAIVNSNLPTVYEGSGDPNAGQEGSPPSQSAPQTTPQMIKEPIFPADTSRNMPPAHTVMKPQKYYHYNTLGQPVELLPADIYRFQEPDLPQTLSPQQVSTKLKNDPARYSNVKSTVSKTSLMGNRPVGRTPSRGQLQQIYNQYKGSQSYTQQNVKPQNNGASYSEGHLNVPQTNTLRQAPIEKVGGDTAANNAINNAVVNKAAEQKPDQIGDIAPTNKPPGDVVKSSSNHSKVRNGLQDMTYTAYTSSAAWSFHGATPASPYYVGYRYRNKT